jgi:hypothetical protein
VPRLSTGIDCAGQSGRLSRSTPKSLSLLLEVWYSTAMSEETLPGGNTDGAVRIGGVVHRRGLTLDADGTRPAAALGACRR